MKKLAILGLGHIGSYVLDTLKEHGEFETVNGYDLSTGHDLQDVNLLSNIISQYDGVLASTPYFLNTKIARTCAELGRDYFDLTESVEVTEYVKSLNSKSRFVTQCGLAPGMVSIIANHIAKKFDSVRDIHIRVGALPQNANNHLGYYRTWNTEGLINEYIHPCPAIKNNSQVLLDPLGDQETVTLEGITFEAANTSGGLGSMANTWNHLADNVNYKTLRYPGHWNHIRFLHDDLGLKKNFSTYVKLFNDNIPQCTDDLVAILINVTGYIGGKYSIRQYKNIIKNIDGVTAIQLTTGSGVMAVLDSWNRGHLDNLSGWVKQEQIEFMSVWRSEFTTPYWLSDDWDLEWT